MIDRVDEQSIINELKEMDKACLYDQVKKIIDCKTSLNSRELLQIKILLLNELKNRELLSVKLPSPKEGIKFYETSILSLNNVQIDIIIKRCSYVRDRIECHIIGGKLSFIE